MEDSLATPITCLGHRAVLARVISVCVRPLIRCARCPLFLPFPCEIVWSIFTLVETVAHNLWEWQHLLTFLHQDHSIHIIHVYYISEMDSSVALLLTVFLCNWYISSMLVPREHSKPLFNVQGGYIGCSTGNGEKRSNRQACCHAQLCLAAA